MKNSLLKNALKLLQEPTMVPSYALWCLNRTFNLRGPKVSTATGGQLSIWEDFSDFWWGRQLAQLDAGETTLMKTLVADGSRLGRPVVGVDIGAHVGMFSIDMARSGFTSVHGFEANPRTYVRALNHIRLNGINNVNLVCAAMGAGHGLVSFVIEGGTGVNHVDTKDTETNVQRIQVPTVSLDLYCKEKKIDRVDLVKIDVEGYEPWVLGGMKGLLMEGRIGTLIIEICPANLDRTGTTVADIARPLNEAGYDLCEILDSGKPGKTMSLEELEAVRQLPLPFINVFCVKKTVA